MKIFVYIIIAVVAAAIIFGFYVAGSPTSERARRFDEERVSHLRQIQSEVIYYWQTKNRLPGKLSDLENNTRDVSVPKDPRTGDQYEYGILDTNKFRLCANFETNSSDKNIKGNAFPYIETDNWEHESGRKCWDRTIDSDFFKQAPIEPAPPLRKSP